MDLKQGQRIRWSFKSNTDTSFNIHYHEGEKVTYPAKKERVAKDEGVLDVAATQGYCWMWSNKSSNRARIDVREIEVRRLHAGGDALQRRRRVPQRRRVRGLGLDQEPELEAALQVADAAALHQVPARHGRLFDPDAYPFLEGRPHGSHRTTGEVLDTPRVSDGVVYRVLRNLLILDGERLSYRALDVEQIGSVYESMMGFALR